MEGKKQKNIHKGVPHEAWLVTNTRVTKDAIMFAKCRGLQVVAWRYPENRGLQYFIEEKSLYPVTVLPSVHNSTFQRLAKKGILLACDLAKYNPVDLMSDAQLSKKNAEQMISEAKDLCSNGNC